MAVIVSSLVSYVAKIDRRLCVGVAQLKVSCGPVDRLAVRLRLGAGCSSTKDHRTELLRATHLHQVGNVNLSQVSEAPDLIAVLVNGARTPVARLARAG